MKPRPAPASAPAVSASVTAMGDGRPATTAPTPAAPVAPNRNWPWTPMLNRPPLNASPTASPPRISGVAWTSELDQAVDGRREDPRALEQAAYAWNGSNRSSCPVMAGLDRMIRMAPTPSARTTANTGTMASDSARRQRLPGGGAEPAVAGGNRGRRSRPTGNRRIDRGWGAVGSGVTPSPVTPPASRAPQARERPRDRRSPSAARPPPCSRPVRRGSSRSRRDT